MLALCATLAISLAHAGAARGAKRAPLPVAVSFVGSDPGAPVPQDFLGLSFELSSLGQLASYAGSGDFVTMLRSLGPGAIRFGGVTSDKQVAWAELATARAPWASETLDAAELRELGGLAGESGWHVLLTIGLGHFEPEAAALEAAVAKAALGEWLEAIELGNEPNSYTNHSLRSAPWTPVQYDEQVAAYRGTIDAAAPGIPLAGPDVSGSSAFEEWGPAEAVDQRPALLTGHHYPLGCQRDPTIARLLSPQIRQAQAVSLRRYMTISEASETPFRLDETNTVSCGGTPGISNTFASALWAVSYLTQAIDMGVSGINLEGNPANCEGYTPVCAPTPEDLATGSLRAQPEWYALLLARALIGSRPLPTITRSKGRPNVEVTAFAGGNGRLQFVVVDDDPPGARGTAVRLQVGRSFRGASILSLTASSPAARSGVKLGGRSVAPDGSWTVPTRLPRARSRNGAITVDIAPSSAALLTVEPGLK